MIMVYFFSEDRDIIFQLVGCVVFLFCMIFFFIFVLPNIFFNFKYFFHIQLVLILNSRLLKLSFLNFVPQI